MRVITILILLALSISPCSAQGNRTHDLCMSNVQYINTINGDISKPVSIYIDNGFIVKIEDYRKGLELNAKEVIDGEKAFVTPGLWDMHAHPDDPEIWRMNPIQEERDLLMPQFVLNGVLGIRDMAGSLREVSRWKKLGESGKLLVPKIVAGGPLIDGPNPMWDGSVGIESPKEAKHVADSLIKAGVDFLKIYSLLPREIYFSLAQYANEINFPFSGHVPFTVTPTEAAQSGMKSQEHLLEIHKEAAHLREAIENKELDLSQYHGIDRFMAFNQYLLDNFDTTYFKSMIKVFKNTKTWHCPTLSMWYKNAWFEDERISDNQYWSLLPDYMKEYWTVGVNDHLNNRDNTNFIQMKRNLYESYLYITYEMYKAGIPMLIGTDMGANPLCWAGIGVHNEMKAMKEAGMDNLSIIQSATINPAKFLGLSESLGSIDIGKKAHLVLTHKNPIEDIQAFDHIFGIYFQGEWIDKTDREQRLNNIKRQLTQ